MAFYPYMSLVALAALVACTAPAPNEGKPSNLNVAYCEQIARETFNAGKLRYDLCPGYMPDGQKIELN